MYSVEGIKENVQRTHDVGSNKYIIYIVPKDDWFVLNVNFCESLIYNVVHYYVDKQRSNGRTHCYAVNLFVGFAVELESANTPSLCGLLKTHKPGNPMRPIISAVGSFNHEAAKWLSNVLAPLCHHSTVVRDTFSFVKEIQKNDLRGCAIAPFGVKSLFTNILLKFTTNLIVKSLFHDGCTQFIAKLK